MEDTTNVSWPWCLPDQPREATLVPIISWRQPTFCVRVASAGDAWHLAETSTCIGTTLDTVCLSFARTHVITHLQNGRAFISSKCLYMGLLQFGFAFVYLFFCFFGKFRWEICWVMVAMLLKIFCVPICGACSALKLFAFVGDFLLTIRYTCKWTAIEENLV